jgi:hypothetical protein
MNTRKQTEGRNGITAHGVVELAVEHDMRTDGYLRVYKFSGSQLTAAYDAIMTGWYDGRSLSQVIEDVLHP